MWASRWDLRRHCGKRKGLGQSLCLLRHTCTLSVTSLLWPVRLRLLHCLLPSPCDTNTERMLFATSEYMSERPRKEMPGR